MTIRSNTFNVTLFTSATGPLQPDEVLAPAFPASQVHRIRHGIRNPIAVSWTPFSNVSGIRAFETILVNLDENDPDDILVTVSAEPNQQDRLGIRIHLLSERA